MAWKELLWQCRHEEKRAGEKLGMGGREES